MNSIAKSQEMKPHQADIARAGFNVRMMQDGTLEVQDPYHLNGKANAGFDLVNIKNANSARRFLFKRS